MSCCWAWEQKGGSCGYRKVARRDPGDATVLPLDGNADHTSPHVMINSPAVNYTHTHALSGGHVGLVKGE